MWITPENHGQRPIFIHIPGELSADLCGYLSTTVADDPPSSQRYPQKFASPPQAQSGVKAPKFQETRLPRRARTSLTQGPRLKNRSSNPNECVDVPRTP